MARRFSYTKERRHEDLCNARTTSLPRTTGSAAGHTSQEAVTSPGQVSSESGDRGCRPVSTQKDTLTATTRRPRGRGARVPPRTASPPRRARKTGGDVSPAGWGMAHPERRTGASGRPGAAEAAETGRASPLGREGPRAGLKCRARWPREQGAGRVSFQARETPPHPPRAGPELAPRHPPASALRAATSPGAQTSRLHWRPRRAPALLPAPRPS